MIWLTADSTNERNNGTESKVSSDGISDEERRTRSTDGNKRRCQVPGPIPAVVSGPRDLTSTSGVSDPNTIPLSAEPNQSRCHSTQWSGLGDPYAGDSVGPHHRRQQPAPCPCIRTISISTSPKGLPNRRPLAPDRAKDRTSGMGHSRVRLERNTRSTWQHREPRTVAQRIRPPHRVRWQRTKQR
jgi:hypothetical protein